MSNLREFDFATVPAESILTAIAEDGGVIVRNFIGQNLRDRLYQELKEHVDGFEPGLPVKGLKALTAGRKTKRFTGLATRAPSFVEVIDHDLMHIWASQAMSNDYWMNTGQAMIVGPGSVNQPLHRDSALWPTFAQLGKQGPECIISIMLAIHDFTLENGATRVVPGSHEWEDFSQSPRPEQIVPAVMPRGSALMYTGKVIHGAGANRTSDQWRFGLHMSFCRSELTPEEANCQTVPWSVARSFSPRVQHMLGFYSLRPWGPEPSLWMADFRELRDKLQPPPETTYLSAGAPTDYASISKAANQKVKTTSSTATLEAISHAAHLK